MTRERTFVDLSTVGVNGFVSAEQVLFLRRNVFADGVVCTRELDALFDLAARARHGDPEWHDFFAEAICDFYLREQAPHGYLTDEEFAALKSRVQSASAPPTALELAMLITILEKAVSIPKEMNLFVAERLKAFVLSDQDGDGPVITLADTDFIRRYLFAAGGDGGLAITKDEAAFLFDLNDAAAQAQNDPAWVDLFKNAIANHLMAFIRGVEPVARAEALRVDARFGDDPPRGSGFAALFDRLKAALADPSRAVETRHAARNAAHKGAADQAERITANEADWLADRIGKDGQLHACERVLLAHMRALDAELPPRLRALADQATDKAA